MSDILFRWFVVKGGRWRRLHHSPHTNLYTIFSTLELFLEHCFPQLLCSRVFLVRVPTGYLTTGKPVRFFRHYRLPLSSLVTVPSATMSLNPTSHILLGIKEALKNVYSYTLYFSCTIWDFVTQSCEKGPLRELPGLWCIVSRFWNMKRRVFNIITYDIHKIATVQYSDLGKQFTQIVSIF